MKQFVEGTSEPIAAKEFIAPYEQIPSGMESRCVRVDGLTLLAGLLLDSARA